MICLLVACERAAPVPEQRQVPGAGEGAVPSNVEPAFLAVPDSAWVLVDGLTLVAFHPLVSNDSLEADEDLASALDDLAYHMAGVMDSLEAIGFRFAYRGGDTVWLRTGARRDRVIRHPDSADIGYVFADTAGRSAMVYGVRTSDGLLEFGHEFRLAGGIRPRP
jgi:hypothetical protein